MPERMATVGLRNHMEYTVVLTHIQLDTHTEKSTNYHKSTLQQLLSQEFTWLSRRHSASRLRQSFMEAVETQSGLPRGGCVSGKCGMPGFIHSCFSSTSLLTMMNSSFSLLSSCSFRYAIRSLLCQTKHNAINYGKTLNII